MTNLFDVVPSGLFRPLASPRGAPIYANILLALFAETERHHQPLSHELALSVVLDHLRDPQALDVTADVLTEDEAPPSEAANEPDVQLSRAGAVLRYLTRCGWLIAETQRDFAQLYLLPDYAFRILRTLAEITANQPPPLAGLICSIHDLLQAALAEGNADIRLPEAHRQTAHLLNGLHELHHNIGRHVNQVLEQLSTRGVLEQLFNRYQAEIVDRAYHELRTTDHVSRFRPGVLNAATQITRSNALEVAARQQFERRAAGDIAQANSRLLDQLVEIRDQFEGLDRRLQEIDARHSQFVAAAVRAVELQLAAGSTTSGQLNDILQMLLAEPTSGAYERTQAAFSLFRLELSDAASLASPTRTPQPFAPEVDTMDDPSAQDIDAAREATLNQLQRAIGPERVQAFVRKLLADQPAARAAEIPTDGPVELALLIYLRAYGDRHLGYHIEELGEWIERDGVAYRDFRIVREGERNAEEPT